MQKKQSLTTTLIVVITTAYLLGSGLSILGNSVVRPLLPKLPDQLALFYGGQYSNGYFPGVSTGQWYRLITVVLVHASLLHIASNMYSLWMFGNLLEGIFGTVRFAAIFVISGITASTASVFLGPHNAYSVGASGAIFGLLGALLVIGNRVGLNYQSLVSVVVLNLIVTFSVPGIDWRAHIGGLIGGAIVAYAFKLFSRT
jgi:membrane associated rhomboid family serine protease